MRTRANLAAAIAALAGLAMLAPVTLGRPQSAQEPKEQRKTEAGECVVLPDHDFHLRIPHVGVDGDLIRLHVESALAQARASARWHPDPVVALHGLRAGLAALQESSRQARTLWQDGPAIWIEDGESGWLGISIAEVTAEKAKETKLPAERGVLVSDVEAEGAAGKAGLQNGDIITEFNGQRIEGTVQLRRLVRETVAGRTVPVTVWRDGRSQTLQVEMGSRRAYLRDQLEDRIRDRIVVSPEVRIEGFPQFGIFASPTPTLGISGEDLEGELGKYFNAPDGEGVLVKQVFDDTPAAKAGLKAGDVITHIEGDRIKTISDLRAKLREKRESKSIKVDFLRRGSPMSLNVEIEQPKPPAPRARARRVSA